MNPDTQALLDKMQSLSAQTGISYTGAKSASTSNYRAPVVAAKNPSFGAQIGASLTSIPGQAASAIYHGTVDPFAHLLGNAGNAIAANSNAQTAADVSKQLDQQSKQAKADFQAGHISRQDYVQKVHSISQAAQQQAESVHGQNVKSIAQMAPDAASAIFTAATLGAGGLELGAAKAGAEALGAKLAGGIGAKVAGKLVQGTGDLIGAGKGIGSNVVTQLPGKLVRNAALVQPTVQFAGQTVNDVKSGNLPAAATDAALIAAPSVLGLAGKGLKNALPGIKDAFFGKSATLTDALGVNRVNQFLAQNAGNEQAINSLKRMEMFTENQPAVQHGLKKPGQQLADHLASIGVDPKTTSINDIIKQFDAYASAHGELQAAKEANSASIADVLSHNKQVKAAIKNSAEAPVSTSKPLNLKQQKAFEEAFGTKPTPDMLPGYKAPKLETPKALPVPDAIPQDLVISHDFRKAVPAVVDALKAAGDAPLTLQQREALVSHALQNLGNVNETVRTRIAAALVAGETGNAMAKELKPIIQKNIYEHPQLKLPSGFIATGGPKEVAALPSAAEATKAGMPKIGSNPSGVLGKIGTLMDKAGLGLRTTPASDTSSAIAANLDRRLAARGIATGKTGKQILSALYDETRKTNGVYDPRLLRATPAGMGFERASVARALNLPNDQAKIVLKELKGAFGDVPLGTRSAGEKMTDKLIQHFSPMSTYLKAQGYGRFSYNPFFWVKQGTKSEYIGLLEAQGKPLNAGKLMNSMLGTAPKTETMDMLKSSGYTSRTGAAGGEADFFGNIAPELGQHVSGAQMGSYIQQSMGQAAEQFAKNNKTTVRDILDPKNENPLKPQFSHLMEMIAGYPKGENYLNSNLAKSLNVLVFPSRFETKVGIATAKYFLEQPKVVQLAMVNSLLRANDWVNSPEGTAWTRKNADLIGVLNYFSPTHTLQSIADFAKSGNLGDLGSVGGMPVGVITTMLNHQGVPLPKAITGDDVNPATGQAYTNKIPQGAQARVQQGITDLIGSMFSYPGATVGLPSKTQTLQNYVPGLKINPKNQKTVGPTANAPVDKVTAGLSTTPLSNPVQTVTPASPKVTPIYKPTTKRAKVHAIKPANSKL